MGDSFQAEGEIQFQYNSLKSSFQDFIPEHSTRPDSAPSNPSSDDIVTDLTPSEHVPEHVPDHPEPPLPNPPNPPAPQPDLPAHYPCQPRPLPLLCEASSHHIKPTNRGDSLRLQKVGPQNTVPFPKDMDAESNADPGGVPVDEEPDNQEFANIAHGEELNGSLQSI